VRSVSMPRSIKSHVRNAEFTIKIDISGDHAEIMDEISKEKKRQKQALKIANDNALIEDNRAFRESQQSQLAAIIGNGRRIDRLEQQAS